MLEEILEKAMTDFEETVRAFSPKPEVEELGVVLSVEEGVVKIRGLPSAQSEEVLQFAGGVLGIAFNLDGEEIGAVLLGRSREIEAGSEVRRTGRVIDVPVGDGFLGRVVDATGKPLDGLGPIAASGRRPVEAPAPAIIEREEVQVPLETGIKVVDAMIPIGRGQRELILGDRQTGKTAVAVDAILNQKGKEVICIYCAIGQRNAAIAKVLADLRQKDAMAYTIVVVASGEDVAGLQYITPYAATAMAEYFMRRGRDVLMVYDDLTRHANAYRELSLLLRRPPGREAYPGDIFYLHSRLLERSARLSAAAGGGSITALPICETEAEDMSAYIPTNLISITDGQLYLSPRLFRLGVLPAIDVGRSVSRVGGKAQVPALRGVASDLRLSFAQFEELEDFARFGMRLDDATRKVLEHGRRVREVLKQPQYRTLTQQEEIAILLAVSAGVFDDIPLAEVGEAEEAILKAFSEKRILDSLDLRQKLSDVACATMVRAARDAIFRLGGINANPADSQAAN